MSITKEARDFVRLKEEKAASRDTEAGMEEMRKRVHKEGGEIYIPAAE